MWILKSKSKIIPLIKKRYGKQPSYNMQFKSLKKIYVQNASLEISKVSNLTKYKTITGKKLLVSKQYTLKVLILIITKIYLKQNIFKN